MRLSGGRGPGNVSQVPGKEPDKVIASILPGEGHWTWASLGKRPAGAGVQPLHQSCRAKREGVTWSPGAGPVHLNPDAAHRLDRCEPSSPSRRHLPSPSVLLGLAALPGGPPGCCPPGADHLPPPQSLPERHKPRPHRGTAVVRAGPERKGRQEQALWGHGPQPLAAPQPTDAPTPGHQSLQCESAPTLLSPWSGRSKGGVPRTSGSACTGFQPRRPASLEGRRAAQPSDSVRHPKPRRRLTSPDSAAGPRALPVPPRRPGPER